MSNDLVEVYSVLCDFFERQVLQPGALGAAADDPFRHTSTEARTLTNELLERLRDEGIVIAMGMRGKQL